MIMVMEEEEEKRNNNKKKGIMKDNIMVYVVWYSIVIL